MGAHLIDGKFQSDKYPTTPRNCVPLKITDKSAQDLLWEYAQRRRSVDAEFSADLEAALASVGYVHEDFGPAWMRTALAMVRSYAVGCNLDAENSAAVEQALRLLEAKLADR